MLPHEHMPAVDENTGARPFDGILEIARIGSRDLVQDRVKVTPWVLEDCARLSNSTRTHIALQRCSVSSRVAQILEGPGRPEAPE